MAFVEGFGVFLIEPLDAARQSDLGRLDEQVIVVGHQDPCVQKPAAFFDDARQQTEKAAAVVIIAINVAPFVASAGDVKYRSGKFQTEWTGHKRGRREKKRSRNGFRVGR